MGEAAEAVVPVPGAAEAGEVVVAVQERAEAAPGREAAKGAGVRVSEAEAEAEAEGVAAVEGAVGAPAW
ncbi:hypothetical protein ABT013_33095 [Streptomyces bacillaris]|uniref:hypothetical protein n=1 Tax=Streptomyces bacillaris TaxID=68179 RepID=UPI00335B6C8F